MLADATTVGVILTAIFTGGLALFTYLAHRYAKREGAQDRAMREARARLRTALAEALHKGNDLRVELDRAMAAVGPQLEVAWICDRMDKWGKDVEDLLEGEASYLIPRWRKEPATPPIPVTHGYRLDDGLYYANWIVVRTEHLVEFMRELEPGRHT